MAMSAERQITLANGRTLELRHGDFGPRSCDAFVDGERVGYASAWNDDEGNFCMLRVAVAPHMRRQGVGRALYAQIERDNARELVPAISLSDEAFEFWKSYRPQAVAEDVRHRKTELLGRKVMRKSDVRGPNGHGRLATITRVFGHGVTAQFDDATERAGSECIIARQALDAALEQAAQVLKARQGEPVMDAAVPQLNLHAVWETALALRVPAQMVVDTLSMSTQQLSQRCDEGPSNCLEVRAYPRYPLGSAGVPVKVADPRQCYVHFLDEVPSAQVMPTEHEGEIRKHPTFDAYVAMLRAGHQPPYVTLYERDVLARQAEQPRYSTTNRRRCLTAQELGRPLQGWVGVDNLATRLPLKVGDVQDAYSQAVQRWSNAQRQAEQITQQALQGAANAAAAGMLQAEIGEPASADDQPEEAAVTSWPRQRA